MWLRSDPKALICSMARFPLNFEKKSVPVIRPMSKQHLNKSKVQRKKMFLVSVAGLFDERYSNMTAAVTGTDLQCCLLICSEWEVLTSERQTHHDPPIHSAGKPGTNRQIDCHVLE